MPELRNSYREELEKQEQGCGRGHDPSVCSFARKGKKHTPDLPAGKSQWKYTEIRKDGRQRTHFAS